MSKRYQLVKVKWVDSCFHTGWRKDASPSTCRTIGFLVQDTKEKLTLAMSVSPNTNNFSDAMCIPRCAVKKVKKLR